MEIEIGGRLETVLLVWALVAWLASLIWGLRGK